jgi:Tol biopolymer transport system component
MLPVFILLGAVVTLINVRAQAPKQAQILFTSDRDGNFEIYVMDADGKNQRRLTNHPEKDLCPVWSPDGQKIAFHTKRDWKAGFGWEIYVMDADGGNQRSVTNHPARQEYSPAWSPDGQRIAFNSDRDGDWEIYVMDADGENPRRLTNSPGQDAFPAWSPDGQRIAFSSMRDGNDEIYVMDINRKNPRRLTNNPAVDGGASWSPDGQKIAFTRTDTPGGVWDGQSSEIYVMDADGKNQRRLTNNLAYDGNPVWLPDGQKIAFSSMRDGNGEVYTMDADGKNQRNLTNDPENAGISDWFDPAFVSVSPAGKLKGTWGEIRRGREFCQIDAAMF